MRSIEKPATPGLSTARVRKSLKWLALGSLLAGCAAVVPYQAKEDLVDAGDSSEAKRRLSETLSRSVEPRVSSVHTEEDFVRYVWQNTVPGVFYVPTTYSNENQIHFANVARCEIYENGFLYVWGPQDQKVDKFRFNTVDEAKACADLFMSFRARRLKK